MICRDCGNGRHESCPGGTRCDCQHRTDRRPAPVPDRLGDTWASPVTVSGFDTEEDTRG